MIILSLDDYMSSLHAKDDGRPGCEYRGALRGSRGRVRQNLQVVSRERERRMRLRREAESHLLYDHLLPVRGGPYSRRPERADRQALRRRQGPSPLALRQGSWSCRHTFLKRFSALSRRVSTRVVSRLSREKD